MGESNITAHSRYRGPQIGEFSRRVHACVFALLFCPPALAEFTEAVCAARIFADGFDDPSELIVSGTLGGLQGGSVVLLLNDDPLEVSSGGSFTFLLTLRTCDSYTVAVQTQPDTPPQTCKVTNGSGVVLNGPVTDIGVNCADAATWDNLIWDQDDWN